MMALVRDTVLAVSGWNDAPTRPRTASKPHHIGALDMTAQSLPFSGIEPLHRLDPRGQLPQAIWPD
jgi:hypothetical protein